MSLGQRLTLQAAVLGAAVWLALPALAQDAGGAPGAQPAPQYNAPEPGGAPAEGAKGDAEPQAPRQPTMPAGCPFRDNKLELIA